MAGRKPSAAVRNFTQPLQQALSCVTRVQLLATEHKSQDRVGVVTLNGGEPTPLAGDGDVRLVATMQYVIVPAKGHLGPYKVRTRGYLYHLLRDERDEVLLFHWHPDGSSRVKTPHLHIGDAVNATGLLAKAHVPTGRISLEEVLLLAIDELGVTTLRPDGRTVIEDTLERFRKHRTWHSTPPA